MKKVLGVAVVLALVFMAGVGAHADLSTGLVAHYPFNGNANDESGNGNHGAVNGATLTVDRNGIANSAYSFDGANDYMDIVESASLDDLTDEISIVCWIKKLNGKDIDGIQLAKRDYSKGSNGLHFFLKIHSRYGISFQHSAASGAPYPGYNAITTKVNPYDKLNDGDWRQIVITHKYEYRTYTRIYIDGENLELNWQWDIGDLPAVVGNSNLVIGKQHHGSSPNPYGGLLDDIRIYNRILSESEINTLYQGVNEPQGTVPSKPSLNVATNGNIVNISWDVENADGYTFIFAPYPGIEYVESFDIGSQTALSAELPDGTALYVVIQAYNSAGVSEYSNVEHFTIEQNSTDEASNDENSWLNSNLSSVNYTLPLTNSQKTVYVEKGIPYTFRPTTVSYVTIFFSANMLSSYYLSDSGGNIAFFRKTNLGSDWVTYWGDHMKSELLSGLFGYGGSILDHFLPDVPSDNNFAAYIEPNETYEISHGGEVTLEQYTIVQYVDRESDIFGDSVDEAYILQVSHGDPIRIDGRLTYLDKDDFIAFTPDFTGIIPFTLSQFKQDIDITISEINESYSENLIYSVTGHDMDIIQDNINVNKNSTYVIHFHNPAWVDISTGTYTMRFGQ